MIEAEAQGREPGAQVEVTFLGGVMVAGSVRRFDPGLADFTLQTEADGSRRVRFAEVRTVAFVGPADVSFALPAAEAREVTVRFYDSTELRGVLEMASHAGRGLFLSTVDGPEARRVFVPLAALRDVVSVKPLGALLVEQGKVTKQMVDQALERQAQMRRATLGTILVDRQHITGPQLDEALEVQRRRPGHRIGEVLMDLGFLSADALQAALEVQRLLRGRRLGELLTEMGFVDQRTVYIALAIQHCMPFLDATSLAPDPEVRSLLPAAFARRFRVLPLSREPDLVRVAVCDAGNLAMRDELRGLLRVAVRDVLVLPDPLVAAIETAYGPAAGGG